jgi:hypothetical protein
MSTPENPVKSIREQVIEQFTAGLGAPALPKDEHHGEWARLLYAQYTISFLNDNNRIWATATIFIPLSLASLLGLKDLSIFNTFLLGIGSCLLMGFWVIIADHHRAFQTAAKDVTKGIEEHAGFRLSETKVGRSKLLNWKLPIKFRGKVTVYEPFYTVQKLRYLMFWGVVGIWTLAILGKGYEFYQARHSARVIPLQNFLAYHAIAYTRLDSSRAVQPAATAPRPATHSAMGTAHPPQPERLRSSTAMRSWTLPCSTSP